MSIGVLAMTAIMLIISNPNKKILKTVAVQIKKGAVVVYPTDTAYAIGCDATNVCAVREIFVIKGRPKIKAMPMIIADLRMAKKFFVLASRNSQLATKYWPGSLSIVVKAKKGIAASALSKGTAAIRVPDEKISQTLAKFLSRPLIATSANLSGMPPCYSVKAFLRQIERQPFRVLGRGKYFYPPPSVGEGRVRAVDIVIDCGALPRRKPSTIVKINNDGAIEILRKGSIRIRHFRSSHPSLPRGRVSGSAQSRRSGRWAEGIR
jgi:L-threonylcarbamoyladenylate synthase